MLCVCDVQVTLLLPNFTAVEITDTSEEATRIRDDLNDYNRRFSGAPRPVCTLGFALHDVFGYSS
jgi:hypothetical protein